MPFPKTLGAHHVRLTVSDFERSLRFYTEVLGFGLRRRFNETSAMLHEISDAEQRFDEARVGLDHLSFRVATAAEVEQAAAHLDEHGIPHSGVKPGRMPGASVVIFRDPDNIQLEYCFSP